MASALLIGAWYGRSRLLILVGIVASLATVVATVIGPGPHGESVYTPRAATDVKDRYEHGAGVIELHLEEVSDIDALAGRTIEVDANVGQVIILVPTSIDATIDAEVTGGGDIEGLPDVEEFGHGEAKAKSLRWTTRTRTSRSTSPCGSVRSRSGTGSAGTTRSTFPHQASRSSSRQERAMSQRHATDVISLVFGVIFAGFTVVWLLQVTDAIDAGQAWVVGPVVLMAAGRRAWWQPSPPRRVG